jgi:predicted ABC-type transport system involved in lysophospholipase L1 biosynthesis ATPase subunit
VLELLIQTKQLLGQTLVMVTHDMSIAERADRIFVMENGNIEPYRH